MPIKDALVELHKLLIVKRISTKKASNRYDQ
jgi:hypothetical protein